MVAYGSAITLIGLVRDGKHFANCVRYIRRNAAKARLQSGKYILYESEVARSIE